MKVIIIKNFCKVLTYLALNGILILDEKGKLVVTRGRSVLYVLCGTAYFLYLGVCGKADASVYGLAGCP